MFGNNPILPLDKGDGSTLIVKSIFATFQGEGPYSGYPSVFIRLSGCNLACSFCDTEFDDGNKMNLGEIVDELKRCWHKFNGKLELPPLVVITGGEPLRQNITPLCEILIKNNVKVQIETNGTLYRPIPKEAEIVCSPKVSKQKYWPIHDGLWQYIIAIKLLVSESLAEYSDIKQALELYRPKNHFGTNKKNSYSIYIQPIDEYDQAKNTANLKLAMLLARTHNCILSVQLHKVIGVE